MKTKQNWKCWAGGLVGIGAMATILTAGIAEDKKPQAATTAETEGEHSEKRAKHRAPHNPKPLSESVERGLQFLAKSQHKSGGWGQGGGWRTGAQGGGRVEGAGVQDPPDVGNTSVALLAFLRAGHSFTEGKYAKTMTSGVEFLLDEIARNKDDSLFVTAVRNTQLQSKIGRYIDTFLAALALSELKGQLPDEAMEKRRKRMLERVVRKIEKNQKQDGTFTGNEGWAATLSQGICSKALNRAWAVGGVTVSGETLRRDQAQNAQGIEAGSTTIAATAAEPSSAGIDIYRYSSKLGGLQELNSNRRKREAAANDVIDSPTAPKKAKEDARREIDLLEENEKQTEAAFAAVGRQLDNDSFVAGFGNNGGEEFLSYMNLSEAMCAKGGKEWIEWDRKVTKMVTGAQNQDGSWAGHHCITGRTFCTSTALLTLMADRAQIQNSGDPSGPRKKGKKNRKESKDA